MTAQVVILLGPVRSGKTHDLVGRYCRTAEGAASSAISRTLWLAPNGRTAAAVRDGLVRSGLRACLNTGVLTFDDLTNQLLASSGSRWKRIDATQRRELVRRVVEVARENRRLSFFAQASTRPGFASLVAAHISELKRRHVDPAAYARIASRGRTDPERSELALLYADYEALRLQCGLLDREDAHNAARDLLAENTPASFRGLDLIIADGFTDFTSTQHDIFRFLAKRATQLYISLPAAAPSTGDSARPELFSKASATLHELKHHFPELEMQHMPPRPLLNPAIDYLAQNVFAHPKKRSTLPPAAVPGLDKIAIVEAASAQDEIVQIARRIKLLLTHGKPPVRPSEILVVLRSLTNAAPRINEVFSAFNIPFYLEAAPPIATAPALQALSSLLALTLDDWPFRRVIAILTNNSLTAFSDESRRAAEWLVRDLQIASGQVALVSRVQALADEPSSPESRGDHLERRVTTATAGLPALVTLSTALQAVPKSATPTEWCAALATLGTTLGLALFIQQVTEVTAIDHAAWRALLTNCAALERLDAWLNQPPRKLTLAEFTTTLRDITTTASLPAAYSESGRVRVLSATAARNISARHLFLAGMSEQAFPSPEVSGSLATDADYRRLADTTGKKVAAKAPAATRAQEEMLLFYEVLSRAEESLTISYPALDDKAQSLPPSPYVVELERLVAGNSDHKIVRTPPQLSPIGRGEIPNSIAEWRIQAVSRATEKDPNRNLLASIFASRTDQPLAASIDAGLRIVHARARGESFGAAEGLLTSPAIAKRLAQRFGKKHTWSASQWETYATCPFRFFMQHVLKLEPLGDLVLETDFARRGSRLHDVLAKFHRDWLILRKQQKLDSPEDEPSAFLAHLQEVANDRKYASKYIGIDAALHELDHRQILKWSKSHFEHQSKYDAACGKLGHQMTPQHFELRFGPDRRGDSLADPDSTNNTFTIKIDDEPVQVTGQIDRIDVAEVDGKTLFNIIDYKSGRSAKFKRDQLLTGQQLQLPIYVEAAQALVFKGQATPLQAGYWSMGAGYDAKGALTDRIDDEHATGGWRDTQTTVHNLIREFIQNIRHGDFPVDSLDDKCTSTCDYRMTCRVAQARSLKKTQAPVDTTTQLD